ncbi:DnaJ domain-containing protein [Xylaria bambusicola]|uniref:DnaJ domain-containing protein n=1 Tax=Xylaria bambusicola TaxID=326684 RepID=UPI0020083B1E|nr:DnaJ domain-containing protein [Xylaria bambusicola]KAI0521114.1 DnaJ domain-containing protein [Xylaria bambusicola]
MSDHYATLGIEKTATNEEITSAYRRLAMKHHPDKNPEDIAGATERFQKIQLAHETLSDEYKRRRYDASLSARNGPPEDMFRNRTRAPGAGVFAFNDEIFWEFFGGRPRPSDLHSEARRAWEEEERREREREVRRVFDEAVRAREKDRKERQEKLRCEREHHDQLEREKAMCAEARRKAEETEKRMAENARSTRFNQETLEQQKRWQQAGATTEEQKAAICLHSGFCEKIPQRKKFKCDVCCAKRGMVAFKCPYCSRNLCQLCVTQYKKERAGVFK